MTVLRLERFGEGKKLPFTLKYLSLSSGPSTTHAVRPYGLDVGAVAHIPPIHTHRANLPANIVAMNCRKDAVKDLMYKPGIAPNATSTRLQSYTSNNRLQPWTHWCSASRPRPGSHKTM